MVGSAADRKVSDAFTAARRLAHALAIDGASRGRRLDLQTFEDIADDILIVRPEDRFADFRFDFCGATIAAEGTGGDVVDARFDDVMGSAYMRRTLKAYGHVRRTELPHLGLNWRTPSDVHRYCSRLLIPLFCGRRVGLILAAIVFHRDPIEDELAAYSRPRPNLPQVAHVRRPLPRPSADLLPFRHA